jgi:hypothetical protein
MLMVLNSLYGFVNFQKSNTKKTLQQAAPKRQLIRKIIKKVFQKNLRRIFSAKHYRAIF